MFYSPQSAGLLFYRVYTLLVLPEVVLNQISAPALCPCWKKVTEQTLSQQKQWDKIKKKQSRWLFNPPFYPGSFPKQCF